MDYYKILGLNTNATKEEIKEAFRTIAKKFHPDKHSSSPKSVKDTATLRFKQASEAYEVLVDDHKRADYNLRFNRTSGRNNNGGYGNYGYGYTYDHRKKSSSSSGGYDYNYGNRKARKKSSSSSGGYDYNYGNRKASVSRFEIAMGYINSRAFLLNVAFAGALISGLAVVEMGRDKIWKMQNSGKSFEEAMESIENTKAVKEKE